MPSFDFLQLKGSAGSSRQHVHGCSLVRARKFYGYCSFEEFFVKIYLYPDVVYNFLFFLQYVFTCTAVHPAKPLVCISYDDSMSTLLEYFLPKKSKP